MLTTAPLYLILWPTDRFDSLANPRFTDVESEAQWRGEAEEQGRDPRALRPAGSWGRAALKLGGWSWEHTQPCTKHHTQVSRQGPRLRAQRDDGTDHPGSGPLVVGPGHPILASGQAPCGSYTICQPWRGCRGRSLTPVAYKTLPESYPGLRGMCVSLPVSFPLTWRTEKESW